MITATLAYGDLGAAAVEAREILNRTPLPMGITAMVSGQNDEMQDSFRSMRFALVLAIFLVYLVMASQFESLIHPFVILFSIPSRSSAPYWRCSSRERQSTSSRSSA